MYRKTEFNRNLWSRCGITRHFGLFLALFCVSFHVTLGLKYYYGDGSYFIGEVDEHGRPSGHGQFHNTSGALGKPILLCFIYLELSNIIFVYVCVLFRHKRLYLYALQNMTESSPKAIHMDMVHGTVKMVQYLKANFVTADQAEKLHT